MDRMIHFTQQFHIFRCVIQLLLAEITAPVGTLLFLIDLHTEDCTWARPCLTAASRSSTASKQASNHVPDPLDATHML